MQAVVLSIHLILALALILVVLLQRSEGGALGMGGGGVMTSRGAATALSKVTWAIGIAFVVTSLALTILAARDSRSDSVVDGIDTSAPAVTPAAPTPGLDGDLLPKVPGAATDAPVTPPPADTAVPPPAAGTGATPPAADTGTTPTPVAPTTAPAPAAPAEDGPATPPPAQ